MTSTTPIRAARADAMWRELTERAEAIDSLAERLGDDDDIHGDADDWRDTVATATHMTGVVAHLALHGPTARGRMTTRESDEWVQALGRLYALNVRAVTAHLRAEAGWSARQVDVALNDLAEQERIRLVAEGGGDIRIELLRRRPPVEVEVAA
jgi:hypothetical protein